MFAHAGQSRAIPPKSQEVLGRPRKSPEVSRKLWPNKCRASLLFNVCFVILKPALVVPRKVPGSPRKFPEVPRKFASVPRKSPEVPGSYQRVALCLKTKSVRGRLFVVGTHGCKCICACIQEFQAKKFTTLKIRVEHMQL